MKQPTPDILVARLRRVSAGLDRAGLDALVVTHVPNIRYLTGFGGSSAVAVIAGNRLVFITDGRYATEVAEVVKPACPPLELVVVDSTYDDALARVVAGLEARRVGVEGAYLSVARFNLLVSKLSAGGGPRPDLLLADRLIEAERLRKDAAEIVLFREAAAMLDEVAVGILDHVREGMREAEIAADIDWRIKRGGFERTSFETIVASGPNAALPHARPGHRALSRGDLVILDFGGVHGGYCVDMTRTVVVGESSAEARRLFDAVAAAQAAAIAEVRPGVTAGGVDAAARAALERVGLAGAFTHGTGHGLGLEIHEEPRVGPIRANAGGVQVAVRDEVLTPGVVITIEPGVYVPGMGGVRIEDDVLVTEEGAEVLTRAPRTWRVV